MSWNRGVVQMSVRQAPARPFDASAVAADAVVGALSGFILGWFDAGQLLATAGSPVVRAAYKVPLHVLWVSPLTSAPVLAVLGVVIGIAARAWMRSRPEYLPRMFVLGGVSFVAIFLSAWVLRIIHPVAALVLALGGAVALSRLARTSGQRLERPLRRSLVAATLILPLLAPLEAVYPRLVERRAIGKLPPAAGGDNVIMLVLDTVRRDRFYRDDGAVIAPYLEGLAKESRWYSNAWAASSWSLPSQATLLTGLSPEEHGAYWPRLELRDNVVPLAAELAQHGYAGAAFSGNDSWVIPELLGDGFVRFEALTLADARQRSIMGRLSRPIRRLFGIDELSGGLNAETLLNHAWDFIRHQSGRPVFVYVCLMDVNRAYYETSNDEPVWSDPVPLGRRVKAYDSTLTAVDGEIAKFLERLRSSGIMDRSVVAITSDHGESFGKGYNGDHDPVGHGSSLFPEQVRVPLWIRVPRGALTGKEDRPVSLEALPGTLLQLAGLTDGTWKTLPADSATILDDVMLVLRYQDRKLNGRVDGRWLHLIDSAQSPPWQDSVDLLRHDGDSVRRPGK